MPMHAITLMPSDMTVARQVLASHHAARGTVKVFSLSSRSSEESHWRFPDSSTEASYLSVLKNIVSDTRGLNFYCRRFLFSLQENCTGSFQTPQPKLVASVS